MPYGYARPASAEDILDRTLYDTPFNLHKYEEGLRVASKIETPACFS